MTPPELHEGRPIGAETAQERPQSPVFVHHVAVDAVQENNNIQSDNITVNSSITGHVGDSGRHIFSYTELKGALCNFSRAVKKTKRQLLM